MNIMEELLGIEEARRKLGRLVTQVVQKRYKRKLLGDR
jgi:ABC-type polysaccharide/polyol phosphate export permease